MHNLLSPNQFNEWRHLEQTINEIKQLDDEHQKLNDYYECLIECDSLNQSECKKICRRILM
jgi:phosphomevalonate kinase